MTESILNSTKKVLGIAEDYPVFDTDIVIHINSVFNTLTQLGIGPEQGYMIADASDLWDDFLDLDVNLNSVKTYVFLRVKILFDPPNSSYLLNALDKQIQELEWRLNVYREGRSRANHHS